MIVALCWMAGCQKPPPPSDFEQIKTAFQIQDYATVRRLGREIPKTHEHWAEIQVIMGQSESLSRGAKFAIPHLDSVPRDRSPVSYEAVRALAEVHLKVGTLFRAAEDYRYMLVRDPKSMLNHTKLVQILLQSGIRAEADEHLLWLLQHARLEIQELIAFSIPERSDSEYGSLKPALQFNADDPYVNLGMAFEEVRESRRDRARERLWKVVESHPEIAEAQSLLGELVIDLGLDSLPGWNAQLPAAIQSHSGIWYVRGLWATAIQNNKVAARCFWETLKQRPHDRRANEQLGKVLISLDPDAATRFGRRALDLKEYAECAEKIPTAQGKERNALFVRIVDLLVGMGRHWEARGWVRVASETLDPAHKLVQEMQAKVKADADLPRFAPENDLTRSYDLSSYPDFGTFEIPMQTKTSSPSGQKSN